MATLKLSTIDEEAAACRTAWAAMPDAEYGVHIHHTGLAEPVSEPIKKRITYILNNKPENERALRLRLMRPITAMQCEVYNEATASAWKVYNEATASAWKAYEEARASAGKAYDEAIAPARKAYDEALNKAHGLLCTTPGCPYKNGSIF